MFSCLHILTIWKYLILYLSHWHEAFSSCTKAKLWSVSEIIVGGIQGRYLDLNSHSDFLLTKTGMSTGSKSVYFVCVLEDCVDFILEMSIGHDEYF